MVNQPNSQAGRFDESALSREVTLFDYLSIIARRKWWVLASALIFGTAAAVYAFTADRLYRVEVIVASAGESNQGLLGALSGQLGSIAGAIGLGQLQQGDPSLEAIATLTSPDFLQRFTEDRQLLPVLFADSWDEASGEWLVDDPEDVPTLADAYHLWIDNLLDARQDRDTGFWTIAVIWRDRVQAADWATALVEALNEHKRRKDTREAKQAIEYLRRELERTSNVEMQQSIYSLIESQMQVEMLAAVREDYALRVIGPAVVPDPDQYEYPRRGVLIFFGIVAGLALGVVAAFMAEYVYTARLSSRRISSEG